MQSSSCAFLSLWYCFHVGLGACSSFLVTRYDGMKLVVAHSPVDGHLVGLQILVFSHLLQGTFLYVFPRTHGQAFLLGTDLGTMGTCSPLGDGASAFSEQFSQHIHQPRSLGSRPWTQGSGCHWVLATWQVGVGEVTTGPLPRPPCV